MDYQLHLTDNEKIISDIDDQGEITLNRRIFERRGFHNTTFVSNDAIFHDAANKTWQRQLSNKKAGKYEWVQITNHVSNKRNKQMEKRK